MSAELQEITDGEFESQVIGRSGVTVVDFWASWCGPCRMLAPILKEIQGELGDKIKIVKMNTDSEQQVAARYNVQGLPTMILFKGGEMQGNMVGLKSKSDVLGWINNYVD